eukprot:7393033-Pyramimonas_sp.AAC.1
MATMGFASSNWLCCSLPLEGDVVPVPPAPARTGSFDGDEPAELPDVENDEALLESSSARGDTLSMMRPTSSSNQTCFW